MSSFKLELQPFSPTAGWKVLWNEFYAINPSDNIYPEGSDKMPSWSLLSSTLLQLEHRDMNLVLDIGWGARIRPRWAFLYNSYSSR